MPSKPLVHIQNLSKDFGKLRAVEDFSLEIFRGEILGLVGESGCGKSTVGRCLVQLYQASEGRILFEGEDIRQVSDLPRKAQMIFQDPYASLNPRMTVQDIVGEALDIHKLAKGPKRASRVEELLRLVGLESSHMSRFPHEFSGGQRQRIGIARALAAEPRFLVCDEAVSALDVSVQAQIVRLLKNLQTRLGLTYLFIAHDLAMMGHLADRMAVMYLGKLVELAPSSELFSNPLHPYTEALLSAVPIPDPDQSLGRSRIRLSGEVPSPLNRPPACVFAGRCPKVMPICHKEPPRLKSKNANRFVACHLYES